MADGDWTPTTAPTIPGQVADKPVIYRSTAALWGLLALIAAGVIGSVWQIMIGQPNEDSEAMEASIAALQKQVTQLQQVTVDHGGVLDNRIPKRFTTVIERMNQMSGRMSQIDTSVSRLALRNARPDPFTGEDGDKLEARIQREQTRDERSFAKNIDDLTDRIKRVEVFCQIRPEPQAKGPQR